METRGRNREGVATGLIGLLLNLLLGGGKMAVGVLSGSVAITTDAVNNFSDAAGSLVTVSSFVLGGRKADREHPYGHGRYEYIASLLIGAAIVMVGVEFAISSVQKIIHPTAVDFSAALVAVLAASIGIKLFMGAFYTVRNRRIRSDTLKAAAADSFSDSAVTAVVLLGVFLSGRLPFAADGVAGALVSLVVMAGGVKIVLSTVGRLLGRQCNADFEKRLLSIVRSDRLVVGTHDLKVHDYGPNMMLASVHAEFDKDLSITDAHRVIDELEHRAYAEMGVELVIHCDPIDTSDTLVNRVRHTVKDTLRLYEGAGMHDLGIDYGEKVVSFHICLPERYKSEERHIIEVLTREINRIVEFSVMVEVDLVYAQKEAK